MSRKRVDEEVSAVDRRIAQREQAVRDALNDHQEELVALGILFGNYRMDPHPELVTSALTTITELELMMLPEHRYGLAGALVGVSSLHPEHKDSWKAHSPKLFAAAERLVPSDEAEAQLSGGHIEFLWMNWMTTGDPQLLRRIFKEAHKGGEAGERATIIVASHAELPEVQGELLRSAAAGRAVASAPVALPPQGTVERKDVPQAEVTALNCHVTALPNGMQRVILVGWTPAQGGTFMIITPDGQDAPDFPKKWAGKPVVVTKADAQQLAIHQQILKRMEEP